MSLKRWEDSVKIAKIRLGLDPKDFTRIQGKLLKEAQTIYRILMLNKNVSKTDINLIISKSGNTLVLVDRIKAGGLICDNLPQANFVSGAMKSTDRKDHYDGINEGTNQIVVATYGVAAVGINIPRIFNLVLIEPGKSFVRVIQSIGRGIRKAEDKDNVQIWDITSSAKFSKKHLTERKKFYKEANYPFTIEKVNWQ